MTMTVALNITLNATNFTASQIAAHNIAQAVIMLVAAATAISAADHYKILGNRRPHATTATATITAAAAWGLSATLAARSALIEQVGAASVTVIVALCATMTIWKAKQTYEVAKKWRTGYLGSSKEPC